MTFDEWFALQFPDTEMDEGEKNIYAGAYLAGYDEGYEVGIEEIMNK